MTAPDPNRRTTVFVMEHIHGDALAMLREHVRLVLPEDDAVGNWQEQADAIIVRSRRVPRAEIAKTTRLKVIGKHGAGTDTIDVDAAAEHGIAVVSTPGVNAPSVADLALAMALALSRDLHGHTEALRAGAALTGQRRVGYEIAELPAGIVGLGAIGRAVAARLQTGFGASVAAYDPGIAEADWPSAIDRVETLDRLLARSRLLFIHVGLNDKTRGMIGSHELAALPPNAFVINCSRGGIVDEQALAEALASGRIAGAASDVFEQEPPPPDLLLLKQPNFIATPHIGASTEAGLRRTGVEVVQKVLATLSDR